MKKIKVGIIGAGYIAGVHASVLAQDDRVPSPAVPDVVPACAKRLARASNAASVGTPIELLERCDAVYITTPNTKHVSLALAAIETGKHVFCEKPLATNIADAEAVFEKANEGDCVFQVGHNRRFAPVRSEEHTSELQSPCNLVCCLLLEYKN